MGKYDLKGIGKPEERAQEKQQPPSPAAAKTMGGRQPGKRSTPGFTRTTVYMRDETKLKAVRLLQDLKDKRDLSDLIESLVGAWVSKHSNA
jgi:hypothetical protein